MNRFIYVAACSAGPVKIGITNNPRQRIEAIRNASPFLVELAHSSAVDGDAAAVERQSHDILQAHRLSGEWFSATVSDAIDAIKQAASACNAKLLDDPPPTASQTLITIRLTPSEKAALKTAATDEGTTVSALILHEARRKLRRKGYL